MSHPVEIVQAIYRSFSAGDIPGVLQHLSSEVQWEAWTDHTAQAAGHPLFAARQGPQGAVAFFEQLGALACIHEFQVREVLGSSRSAAAEVVIDYTYLPTGARVRDEELHLWRFDEAGRVCRFRHYIDTAKHLQAAGLLPPHPAAPDSRPSPRS